MKGGTLLPGQNDGFALFSPGTWGNSDVSDFELGKFPFLWWKPLLREKPFQWVLQKSTHKQRRSRDEVKITHKTCKPPKFNSSPLKMVPFQGANVKLRRCTCFVGNVMSTLYELFVCKTPRYQVKGFSMNFRSGLSSQVSLISAGCSIWIGGRICCWKKPWVHVSWALR